MSIEEFKNIKGKFKERYCCMYFSVFINPQSDDFFRFSYNGSNVDIGCVCFGDESITNMFVWLCKVLEFYINQKKKEQCCYFFLSENY